MHSNEQEKLRESSYSRDALTIDRVIRELVWNLNPQQLIFDSQTVNYTVSIGSNLVPGISYTEMSFGTNRESGIFIQQYDDDTIAVIAENVPFLFGDTETDPKKGKLQGFYARLLPNADAHGHTVDIFLLYPKDSTNFFRPKDKGATELRPITALFEQKQRPVPEEKNKGLKALTTLFNKMNTILREANTAKSTSKQLH